MKKIKRLIKLIKKKRKLKPRFGICHECFMVYEVNKDKNCWCPKEVI